MENKVQPYPASFDIDYPNEVDRFTTFARIIWVIPILVILSILTGTFAGGFMNEAGKNVVQSGYDFTVGLSIVTALMIIFRQVYPRWWFNFALELTRLSARVGAYLFLLTDRYPSTIDQQTVQLEINYPNVKKDLNRWLPIVKWLLAIPHYIVLAILVIAALGATVIAWFSIIFTGRYPKGLFDYVVGVGRWITRVNAYAFLLTTDKYPPFTLK